MTPTRRGLVRLRDAAKRLGVSETTVRRMVGRGELVAFHVLDGGRRRAFVSESSLNKLDSERRAKRRAEAEARWRESQRKPALVLPKSPEEREATLRRVREAAAALKERVERRMDER